MNSTSEEWVRRLFNPTAGDRLENRKLPPASNGAGTPERKDYSFLAPAPSTSRFSPSARVCSSILALQFPRPFDLHQSLQQRHRTGVLSIHECHPVLVQREKLGRRIEVVNQPGAVRMPGIADCTAQLPSTVKGHQNPFLGGAGGSCLLGWMKTRFHPGDGNRLLWNTQVAAILLNRQVRILGPQQIR